VRLAGAAVAVALVVLAGCAHGAPGVETAWKWTAPAPAYVGMPATNGHDAAFTFGHSYLVLVDAAGKERWRSRLVGLRDVAPAFTRESVVAATDDGVATFRRSDGALVSQAVLGDRASTPVTAAGRVVVTTWDGRLVAIGGWSRQLDGESLGPPAAAAGVVVASWDTGVAAFDAGSGTPRWRHELGAPGTSAPAVSAGVAIVVAGDRRAHAFDLRTGEERWSIAMTGAGSPEAPPAASGADIAVVDRLGHLTLVDARTGRRRWSADGHAAVERGGPAFVGFAVVQPLEDGRLLVASRHGRRFVDPPGRVSGVAAAGRRAYVATREATPSFFAALTVSYDGKAAKNR